MTEFQPEDYARYRLQRAKETMDEVESHIENKFWNAAVNRMYYACFYAVGALKHQAITEQDKNSDSYLLKPGK